MTPHPKKLVHATLKVCSRRIHRKKGEKYKLATTPKQRCLPYAGISALFSRFSCCSCSIFRHGHVHLIKLDGFDAAGSSRKFTDDAECSSSASFGADASQGPPNLAARQGGGLGGAPLMLFMPWGGERGRQRAAIRAAATRCTLFLACCRPFFHPPAWPREQPPGTTASAPAFFLWQVHSPQSSSTQAPCLEETAVARSAVTHSAGALSTDARSTVAPSAVARSVGSRSAVACVAVAVQSGRVPLRHALPRRAPFDGDGLVGGAHSTMMRSAVARLAVGAFGQGALCRGTLGRNRFGCDAFGRGTCFSKRNLRLFARV